MNSGRENLPSMSHDSNETFDVDEFPKEGDPIVDGDYTKSDALPSLARSQRAILAWIASAASERWLRKATVRCC
jgi:hypothetical protein